MWSLGGSTASRPGVSVDHDFVLQFRRNNHSSSTMSSPSEDEGSSATGLQDMPDEILRSIFSRISHPWRLSFPFICSRFRHLVNLGKVHEFLLAYELGKGFFNAVCYKAEDEWILRRGVHGELGHSVLAIGNNIYWISILTPSYQHKWYVIFPTNKDMIEIPLLPDNSARDFCGVYMNMDCISLGYTLIRANKEKNLDSPVVEFYSSVSNQWGSVLLPDAADAMVHRDNALTSMDVEEENPVLTVFSHGCLVWDCFIIRDDELSYRVRVFRVSDRKFISLHLPGKGYYKFTTKCGDDVVFRSDKESWKLKFEALNFRDVNCDDVGVWKPYDEYCFKAHPGEFSATNNGKEIIYVEAEKIVPQVRIPDGVRVVNDVDKLLPLSSSRGRRHSPAANHVGIWPLEWWNCTT